MNYFFLKKGSLEEEDEEDDMTSAAGGNPNNVGGGGIVSSSNQADSLVSLLSGLSDSASNQLLSNRRHSLTNLKQQHTRDGSLVGQRSVGIRRSARLPSRHQRDYLGGHNEYGISNGSQLGPIEDGGVFLVQF